MSSVAFLPDGAFIKMIINTVLMGQGVKIPDRWTGGSLTN
jgi:hypothetical protein